MQKKVIIIIVAFLLIIQFHPKVKGDEAPDPNYLTTLTSLGETLDSYLENVNVTMLVDKRIANGEGSFKIANPSNEWENFSVVFDPGEETYGMNLRISDKSPDYEFIRYDNFYGEDWSVYGIRFNVSIPPNGSVYTNLTWKYNVDQDSHKNLYYHTHRLVEYLIIGMLGWSQPISTIDVRFVMITDAYESVISRSPEFEVINDEEGRKIYSYHAENFSEDRLLLQVIFRNDDEFNPWTGVFLIQCSMMIVFNKRSFSFPP